MNKLLFVYAAFACVAVSGCSKGVADVNAFTGALSSPDAAQHAAKFKAGATAFVCDVGSVSQLATQIESDVKAGSALIKDTANIYIVSSAVCTVLGGSVAGKTTVPPSASAVIPSSAS